MSVIGGVWNFDEKPVDRDVLTPPGRLVQAFGDDCPFHLERQIRMLCRPFHTTPESRFDDQPFKFSHGLVLTWDGRLDNREDLIAAMGYGSAFERSDAQIVASAFERWNYDCFRRFIGDWALCIWNPSERCLLLARDYIGVRQLFYYPRGDSIMWCSSLASLVLCGDKFSLSDDYIAGYLALRFQGHLTPYSEIRSVAPGTYALVQADRITIRPFWSFNPLHKTRYKRDAEYEEHYRHLFRRSIERRLRADSPVLADLSGGLDSSAIVCVADSILREKGAPTTALDTFSYSYLDEPDGNDMEYVDAVEALRTPKGHRVELRGYGNSFSLQPSFSATPAFHPRGEVIEARTRILSKHGYRIHISGVGGDEFLGQAVEARLLIADFMFHWRFSRAWRELMSWSLFWRQPLTRLFFQTLSVLFPASVRCRMEEIQVPAWINKDFAEHKKLIFQLLSLADTPASWPPAARDAFQTHSRLAGILTNFGPSSAEERYPFLDQELTEFLMSIPLEQQLRPGDRRSLMRRALAGILPPNVLLRRTKQMESRGFLVTLNKHWSELQKMMEAPLSSRLSMTNQSELYRALEEMRNGHLVRESAILLRGIFLEVWLRAMEENGVISIKGALDDLGLKMPELVREAGPVRI